MVKNLASVKGHLSTFTPRFNLATGDLVGFEVHVTESKVQELQNALRQNGGGGIWSPMAGYLKRWEDKLGKPLYLSVEIVLMSDCAMFSLYVDKALEHLQPLQLEIILGYRPGNGLTPIVQIPRILGLLGAVGVRKGLAAGWLFDAPSIACLEQMDIVKLNKGMIVDIKSDIARSSQLQVLIGKLAAKDIGFMADGLYSKDDVTSAILMGIKYGQGYFFNNISRFSPNQRGLSRKIIRTRFYENCMSWPFPVCWS